MVCDNGCFITAMHATGEMGCCLCGPCWRFKKKRRTGATSSVDSRQEFCTGGCEHWTWVHEAEESPLLETAAREHLVKTQQAGKGLVGRCLLQGYGTVNMWWHDLTEIRYYAVAGRQRVTVANVTCTTVEELLEVVFSVGSMQRRYKDSRLGFWVSSEADKFFNGHQPVKMWTWKQRNLQCWEPLSSNHCWRHSRQRRLSACYSEL
jgi:hypothetical protein